MLMGDPTRKRTAYRNSRRQQGFSHDDHVACNDLLNCWPSAGLRAKTTSRIHCSVLPFDLEFAFQLYSILLVVLAIQDLSDESRRAAGSIIGGGTPKPSPDRPAYGSGA